MDFLPLLSNSLHIVQTELAASSTTPKAT